MGNIVEPAMQRHRRQWGSHREALLFLAWTSWGSAPEPTCAVGVEEGLRTVRDGSLLQPTLFVPRLLSSLPEASLPS